MKSRRVRKQRSRRKLRGGAPTVYVFIFYEADGVLEVGHNPYSIEIEAGQTLNGFGINENQIAFNTDNEPLNKEQSLLSQSDKIKNNIIIIRKTPTTPLL